MPANPHDDPEDRRFLESTSGDNGGLPTVAEANRYREAKYRASIVAVTLFLLALGVKLLVMIAEITPQPRTMKLDNLTLDQQEALLRIHGINTEPIPSTTNGNSKAEDETEH